MKVRGERECRDCGARWSYYETGSVACPDCGSVQSVGVDERHHHTDGDATLDLDAARAAAVKDRHREAAAEAARAAREYLASRGFVVGGDLRPLDDRYLAAADLRAAAAFLDASLVADEAALEYFLALLREAPEGERPASVPDAMRDARGLAAASAAGDYRSEMAAWARESDAPPETAGLLQRLDGHVTRVEALDGAVASGEADRLVAAARAVGAYLRAGEATDLEAARARLDALR